MQLDYFYKQMFVTGIQAEHCVLTIEESRLYMTPVAGARCFVNGAPVLEKILLHNGDRLLWGNHHFFRVNCPKLPGGNVKIVLHTE